MLEGKALNLADAEHVRHFEYGGKIKRVHVTPEQLAALNRGELGVLQQDGRYPGHRRHPGRGRGHLSHGRRPQDRP